MLKRVHLTALLLAVCFSSSAWAEVRPIRFKNGTLNLAKKTPEQLRADLSDVASRAAVSHVILQFEQPVTPEMKEKLQAGGVRLLDYLGDNGFFAAVTGAQFNPAALGGVPSLTRLGDIQRPQKLHSDLLLDRLHDWMIVGAKTEPQKEGASGASDSQPVVDPMVGVYIKFHGDVPLDPSAVKVVHQFGAAIRSRLEPINSLVIELPYSQIKPLSDNDAVQWIEPPLPMYSEVNNSNRAITQADTVQAAPYNLNGAGVNAMVYDGGRVFTTHLDFQNRAFVGAGELACTAVSDHSTHVAGTIGGAGIANALFKGMAPAVGIISYGYNQNPSCTLSAGFLYTDPGDMQADYSEAINTYNAHIANNSIGTNTAPNGFDCNWEGDYGLTSAVIDSIVRGGASNSGAPFRIVWANGNERQTTRCGTTYHTTAPPACAKNHITVGALNSNDDSVTSFTSWGPSDDGRMKPDISAPGCQSSDDNGVTSCSSSGTSSYAVKCGTSMASPTVCGLGALLLQDFRAQFPARPDFRNSTLKILLAHTAVDLFNVGPDNQTGYGSVRVQAAVDFMRTGNFLENTVNQGGTYNVLVIVNPSDTVMKVTLAWDDPPAAPNPVGTLVNDLDLVVFDPGNVQRFPWTLDINNPGNAAVQTQKNSLDNIEQVLVNNPTPGVYRVEVRGFIVPQGPQPFSLCASPQLVNCSRAGTAALDKSKYPCSSTATLTVVDCDLNTDDNRIETVDVTINSTSELGGEPVTLTESGPQTALFRGTINLSTVDSPSVLQVAHGDTVTLTYIDADDGAGHQDVTVTATATVDCQPPVISNVATTNIGARTATVTFNTDESAKGTVRWGTSCGSLSNTVAEAAFSTSHSLVINGLSPNSTYYFAVDAVDVAGNSASDDNGGSCYSFSTPNIPELFTENFDGSDNDLDNKSILFYPDPGISHYKACTIDITSLPTDPAGGTHITTWTSGTGDDGYRTLALSGGATVKLHSVSYGTVFIGTNGYITFNSGETAYLESLAAHFTQPRVAAMFNDLDVRTTGQISYKQLGDRLAVTWLNVPHFNLPTQLNTLQIELFFDGRITLSYLVVGDTDGLAGLSPGGGVPPDFFESDLSAETSGCGPLPPSAGSGSVSTPPNTFINVTLSGSDPNHDPLTYIITSLPPNGNLRDPVAGGTILSVPHTLASGGNVVRYTPNPCVACPTSESFQFKVNDGGLPPNGGDSNTATISVSIVTPPAVFYSFPMNSDPGWTTMGQWAYGTPTGTCADPSSGFTGSNVYGYNLAGCYPNSLTPIQYLTTGAISCSGLSGVTLRFRRWLGVESNSYDHATVDVSNNGTTWTNIYANGSATFQDTSWSLQTFDISATADNQPTVYVRWGMGTTDGSVVESGWNIDDVEILANGSSNCSGFTHGDMNFDTKVDGGDIDKFVRTITDPGSATAQEICAADCLTDTALNLLDVDEFVILLLDNPVP